MTKFTVISYMNFSRSLFFNNGGKCWENDRIKSQSMKYYWHPCQE